MNNAVINDIYDQLSKILKNDQKYSNSVIARLLVKCIGAQSDINIYYAAYPPLLDVAELGAALEYASGEYQTDTIQQIRYKMSELKHLLPDIS
jgi:hypothetical protein